MGIGATADPLKSRSSASLVDTIMTFSPLLSRSRAVASTFGLLAAFGAATSAQAQVEIPDRFPELLALAAPELSRIDARFEEELARLKVLWAQRGMGGPLPTAAQ